MLLKKYRAFNLGWWFGDVFHIIFQVSTFCLFGVCYLFETTAAQISTKTSCRNCDPAAYWKGGAHRGWSSARRLLILWPDFMLLNSLGEDLPYHTLYAMVRSQKLGVSVSYTCFSTNAFAQICVCTCILWRLWLHVFVPSSLLLYDVSLLGDLNITCAYCLHNFFCLCLMFKCHGTSTINNKHRIVVQM